MNKNENNENCIENNGKKLSLNPLKKIPKVVQFSHMNKNNIINFRIKSYNNPKNNRNIKYLNYREKLLKKCNSQILDNKKVLPILSNNYNQNNKKNLSYSLGDNTNKRITALKSPIKLKKINLSPIKQVKIPYLSNSVTVKHNSKEREDKKNLDIFHSMNSPKTKESNSSYRQNINKIDENTNNINNIEEKYKDDHTELSFLHKSNSDENKNEEIEEDDKVTKINENIEKLSKGLLPVKQSYKYRPFKFSKFYRLSKNRNVSAKNIYEYYISEEIKDNNVDNPIYNFTKFIEKKYKNPNKKFNKLYMINKPYLLRIQEIKNNNSIAYKEDFDLKEYQNILCGMMKKRVGNDNIYYLKQDYKKFNEKIDRGFLAYKGRFSKLADKIRNNAPSYLIDKLQKLDKDKLKMKAKYFKINLNNQNKNNDKNNGLDDFEYYLENKYIPNDNIK